MPYFKESFTKNYIFWLVYIVGIIYISIKYGSEKFTLNKII